MTVFEAANQLGIAYSNEFLLRAGTAVARKFFLYQRSLGAKRSKEQDEHGNTFEVWDYPEAFTEIMKDVLKEELRKTKRKSKSNQSNV